MRLFLLLWSALWTLGLPLMRRYLRKRARKDPLYAQHMEERMGHYPRPLPGAVWVHAVSLGEVRSAVPLIRALLDRGERVVVTQFTPAGRRETDRVFAADIAAGRLVSVWVPFELAKCYARFLSAFRPKLGLVMEIEIWPRMVVAARDAGVPLFMCNAQYPADSMARDRRLPIRPAVMRRFAGAFVKSALQKARFDSIGVPAVTVTGEFRFEQPIPAAHLAAAPAARLALAAARPVIAFASVTEPEEDLFLSVIESLAARADRPFLIFIPRAPERFDPVAAALVRRGLAVRRRSEVLSPDLMAGPMAGGGDVLVGDSLGEMYFYLAMADRVAVGGGFTHKGSHNIIEPLALGKPVIVGPNIATIEYPAVEAMEAGVCRQVTPGYLATALTPEGWPGPTPQAIAAFLDMHGGATSRTIAALAPMLDERRA